MISSEILSASGLAEIGLDEILTQEDKLNPDFYINYLTMLIDEVSGPKAAQRLFDHKEAIINQERRIGKILKGTDVVFVNAEEFSPQDLLHEMINVWTKFNSLPRVKQEQHFKDIKACDGQFGRLPQL